MSLAGLVGFLRAEGMPYLEAVQEIAARKKVGVNTVKRAWRESPVSFVLEVEKRCDGSLVWKKIVIPVGGRRRSGPESDMGRRRSVPGPARKAEVRRRTAAPR